ALRVARTRQRVRRRSASAAPRRAYLRVAPLLVFFLLLRRPPGPPLFPYTTLFRSQFAIQQRAAVLLIDTYHKSEGRTLLDWLSRSEEHTSELQSLTNIVCRLLLEKKNSSDAQHGPGSGHPRSQPQRAAGGPRLRGA